MKVLSASPRLLSGQSCFQQEASKVARAMLLCLLKQIIYLINEGRKYEQEQTAPALLFS